MWSTEPEVRRTERLVAGWAALTLLGVGLFATALVPAMSVDRQGPVLPGWHEPPASALGLLLALWQLGLPLDAARRRTAISAAGLRGRYVAVGVVWSAAAPIGLVLFSWAGWVVAVSALAGLVASLALPRGGPSASVLGHVPDERRPDGPGVSPRAFWTTVGVSLLVAVAGLTLAVGLAWE